MIIRDIKARNTFQNIRQGPITISLDFLGINHRDGRGRRRRFLLEFRRSENHRDFYLHQRLQREAGEIRGILICLRFRCAPAQSDKEEQDAQHPLKSEMNEKRRKRRE